MSEISKKVLNFYGDKRGKLPFVEWLESLDSKIQARIRHRLTRIETGNLGDCEPIGVGVFELRLFFGSGYRVYFGLQHGFVVLLLGGGDKSTQSRDIGKATELWLEYLKVITE